MRICSFLPTGTEMLYALGAGRFVVGRSDDCDYPARVRNKPLVVASRVAKLAPQDSLKIHEAVLKLRREGAHQFTVNLPVLKRLKPDLVITQNLCAVCAAAHPEVSTALKQISPIPKTVSLQAKRLDEVFTEIRRLGEAVGRQKAALRLIHLLQERIARIRESVAKTLRQPRVWCCEWLEPLMAAGHWIPEMVELSGGSDGLNSPGAESVWLNWERIRSYDPEVIILMPCSYSLPQTLREAWRLIRRPGFKRLSAVRQKRVFAVETSLYHRSGPRLVEGLELFAHLFHPEFFPAGKLRRRFRPLIR
ncbi:MAG: cobalamin-binding protein [Candidatus Omnitrophica bacterium]|nr:cobalamin-binding protein [Candidatus Omnitrophota bacterium]